MIDNFTKEELMNEKWRDIAGYDGMYQVSDLGRVRSLKFGKVRVLRPGKNGDGYLNVSLFKDKKHKTITVHRLVANTFIPNKDESKNQVNHKDENKQNNRADNLEWCTVSYNNSYNRLQYRRPHPKHKRDKVKDIYNQDLSINENIKIFKANGIECSRYTVTQLRKDLGMTSGITVRDEIRHLYNPDLTIRQNLEVFMANGIDCSRNTVIRLRKDLGLIGRH